MTLGSLFDGMGGFPHSASKFGIETIWASEIEPMPTAVTRLHFLNMKHLGDITEINGSEIEPVDIITGGSPCQDLSVAGKGEGLDGKRSGLFFEQIRVIKEMREATNGQFPRFAIWENVPGAFSSNGGKDFREVIQAFAELAGSDVSVPMPRGNRWQSSGLCVGNGASFGWRTVDAQFWGVPQRRRRIFLVADFGSECIKDVLFINESLQGNSKTRKGAGEAVTNRVRESTKTAGFKGLQGARAGGIGYEEEKCPTLLAGTQTHILEQRIVAGFNGWRSVAGTIEYEEDKLPCLQATMPSNVLEQRLYENHGTDSRVTGPLSVAPTVTARYGTGGNNTPLVRTYSIAGNTIGRKPENGGGSENLIGENSTVRRMTPLECERAQGFPDNWTKYGIDENGNRIEISDTQRYKI